MKKNFLLSILFSCSTLSVLSQNILKYQENDQKVIPIKIDQIGFLINNDWHCYEVVIEKRKDEVIKSTSINLNFSSDDQFSQNGQKGSWKIKRDSFLFLNLETWDERRQNHLLRGHYGIITLTDSTLALTRILTSSIDYRYTYYFENTDLNNKRYNTRFAQKETQGKRFKKFNEQYKQGLTILEENARYTRLVIVSQKNCGYNEKQTKQDGKVAYTKDGISISKFDYDYDTRLAKEIRSNEIAKEGSKEDNFMNGRKN